jgi:hypothetical protein
MGGFKDKSILKDYPHREDAIAATYSMISNAIKSLPTDIHPEIRSAYTKNLVDIGQKQVEIIQHSEAWD